MCLACMDSHTLVSILGSYVHLIICMHLCIIPVVDVWHFPAFVDRAVYGDIEYTAITE